MTQFRSLPLLASLLLGACASQAPKSAPPSGGTAIAPAADAPVRDDAGMTAQPAASGMAAPDALPASAAAPADSQAAAGADTAAAGAPTDAESDFDALYGPTTPQAGANGAPAQPGAAPAYDPWERYNRGMHRFNMAVDRGVARPLATAYTKVVPSPARLGVTNFFDNLGTPLTMVNQLLQGHPVHAMQSLGRFVMNSTLGVAGLFDPASAAGIPRRSEDFGQTLGAWGWRNSRYFELPLFGPRTVRDTFGLAGDIPLSWIRQVDDGGTRFALQGLQLVDTRAQLMSLDSLRDQAPDEYALTRDAWMQRRNYQITRDLRSHREKNNELPEYLRDDKDNTVPGNAMPIPSWVR
ncbi:MlaA family lipoprotein [Xanthomonas citri]|uniref:MlaA family lipoprotein n=1 Tax=Xanthomonas citri TaxID=346 RepID=UPI0001CED1F4|nr:VacJ family lipoprotein [Xanthomonas citri]AMV06522.1 lipoprotein [Xanthomonas citri pv. aurantifolii]ARE58637.1 lipoprotein [Xanthomonas citri pv. aurantifolii]EFF42436.1 lipoprotein [Xanthomonas citri pv. aurantifolii str. ICPB 11122]MCT8357441.1 VacJ family lipoprotein [Xanthomonas citri pv. anacardii]MCT8361521.1 VacJ family lipoprotein [Xanthomonas citri pv. anacardii]